MTDREMVIAAAEKVMGWSVYQSGRCSSIARTRDEHETERILETTHPWESVGWNPLESDADAFMLVDAMAAKGYYFRLHQVSSGAALASFVKAVEPDEDDASEAAENRRRAIVMAALGAVGVAL
jgi:hypothetical protein